MWFQKRKTFHGGLETVQHNSRGVSNIPREFQTPGGWQYSGRHAGKTDGRMPGTVISSMQLSIDAEAHKCCSELIKSSKNVYELKQAIKISSKWERNAVARLIKEQTDKFVEEYIDSIDLHPEPMLTIKVDSKEFTKDVKEAKRQVEDLRQTFEKIFAKSGGK